MIAAPDPRRMFSVQKAEVVVFNGDVQELLTDFEMLHDIVKVHTKQCVYIFSTFKLILWLFSSGAGRRRAAELPGPLHCESNGEPL